MASLNDSMIYNTELFNVVLEAMDNFKPILFCENNGSYQTFSRNNEYISSSTSSSTGFRLAINGGDTNICPSTTATTADLYTPKNISPASQSESEPS